MVIRFNISHPPRHTRTSSPTPPCDPWLSRFPNKAGEGGLHPILAWRKGGNSSPVTPPPPAPRTQPALPGDEAGSLGRHGLLPEQPGRRRSTAGAGQRGSASCRRRAQPCSASRGLQPASSPFRLLSGFSASPRQEGRQAGRQEGRRRRQTSARSGRADGQAGWWTAPNVPPLASVQGKGKERRWPPGAAPAAAAGGGPGSGKGWLRLALGQTGSQCAPCAPTAPAPPLPAGRERRGGRWGPTLEGRKRGGGP